MKLINKDALVAEIEKHLEYANNGILYAQTGIEKGLKKYERDLNAWQHCQSMCKNILSFIDTLDVKEADLEKDVRQILSLYYEGIKYYDDVIRKEREENGGSDLAIKIMDGVVDARELGILYVIDKLKAQKGEKV